MTQQLDNPFLDLAENFEIFLKYGDFIYSQSSMNMSTRHLEFFFTVKSGNKAPIFEALFSLFTKNVFF